MTDKVSKYDYPSCQTGGVKAMNIRGVYEEEQYRLSEEFTDEERKWRKQWLKDQELSPDEPRPMSQELIKEIRNPIRRMLSRPWQFLEDKMTPVFGKTIAQHFRFSVPKLIVITGATYWAWYHLKYNQNDWTQAYGVTMVVNRPICLPGDRNFPVKIEQLQPDDYNDRGFKSRKVFLD